MRRRQIFGAFAPKAFGASHRIRLRRTRLTMLTPVRVALRVPERHGLVSALPLRFGLLNGPQSRQPVLRFSEIGFDPQRLLVLVDGFPELARLLQGDPQIVVRLGIVGLDP